MSETVSDILARAETLARLYVDALAVSDGISTTKMMRRQDLPLEDFLADMDAGVSDEGGRLRVDMTLAAILTARAIAESPHLSGRLRRGEDAVVVIETHTQEWVDLIEEVVICCATHKASSKKTILSRDGTERSHIPTKGNDIIQRALTRAWPIVGIAPDPKRHLPSVLLRAAEYLLPVPPVDGWAVRLLLEAVTGRPFGGEIDEAIVRSAEIGDFSLAFRPGYSADQCLDRLAEFVSNKSTFSGDGPTLEGMHGYGEAATWGLELVADIAEYRAGRLKWNEIANRSLLLAGAPGLGKTAYSRALAKSLGVHLVTTSVADWNASNYLSGTLQAMRNAFQEAKRHAPSVLFIDELDGISSRERLTGDYVEYWTQVVNLLLELMSNAAELEGVILVAATNHPEKIDKAILRAGRIDRHITLHRPNPEDLSKIFRYCLGPEELADEDLMPLALAAAGSTGADVTAWVRRARAAARRQKVVLTMDHLLTEIRGGVPEFSRELRHRISVHEAGHVIVARELDLGVVKATAIVHSGGTTEIDFGQGQDVDAPAIGRMITFLLAGRAAEQLIIGNCGAGSGGNNEENDLARATELAIKVESAFGFGEALGLVHLKIDHPKTLAMMPEVLQAVRRRLDDGMVVATEILARHQDCLARLTDELGRRGYLSADDIAAALNAPAKSRDVAA